MNTGRIVPFVGYNYIFNPKSICQRFDPGIFNDTELAVREYSAYISESFKDNTSMQNALNFKIADIIMSDCTTRYFTNKDNPNSLRERKAEFCDFIDKNAAYKNAFSQLKAGFPFSFYSFCIKKNKAGLLFYSFALINGIIRTMTVKE